MPLLIRVPWAPQSAGRVVSAPVESDPSRLAGLAGVVSTVPESQPLTADRALFFGGAGDDRTWRARLLAGHGLLVGRVEAQRPQRHAAAAQPHGLLYARRARRFTAWHEWSHLAPKGRRSPPSLRPRG